MDILKAIEKMEKGYKVKPKSWIGSGYWTIKKKRIVCSDMNVKTNTPHNVVLLKMKNWVVVKDKLTKG